MSGPQLSIVDIVVFIELDTINSMYKQDIHDDCPKLKSWFAKLSAAPELKKSQKDFLTVLSNWDLYGLAH